MTEIDLKLAERVMRVLADAGLASPRALELHSALASDLGLGTVDGIWAIAEAVVIRFPVELRWSEIKDWATVADVVRSVQAALRQAQGERVAGR